MIMNPTRGAPAVSAGERGKRHRRGAFPSEPLGQCVGGPLNARSELCVVIDEGTIVEEHASGAAYEARVSSREREHRRCFGVVHGQYAVTREGREVGRLSDLDRTGAMGETNRARAVDG